MQSLWSPWRSEYIASSDERDKGECFLCLCAAAEQFNSDNLVVARFEHTMVVLNRFPYNAGHLLIAPLEHEGEITNLNRDQSHELMDVLQLSLSITQSVMSPHGCNVGVNLGRIAGAGVPSHLHVHTVPRWSGDTNFMPTIADVKVVSNSIDELWNKFHAAFFNAHIA